MKMSDLENRIRCFDWIDADDKMWLVCPEQNGIFCVDKCSNVAHHEAFFDERMKFNSQWWYLSLLKVEENIVCIPYKSNHIDIYSLDNRTVQHIQIDEELDLCHEMYNLENKFYRGYVNGKYVILNAYNYPAIIYFDIDTYNINYLTSWFDNKNIDIYHSNYKCYFGDGIVRMGDEIYFPVSCFAAILILNLQTMKSRLKYLECDSDGYEGITLNDNDIYLVSRKFNKYYLVLWNIVDDLVKEIRIPFYGLSHAWVSFLRPLYFDFKIYLIPATADHFYVVDLKGGDVKIAQELEYMIDDFPKNVPDFKVAQYEQNGNVVTFHTWWDYQWHEYNLETGMCKKYEVKNEDKKYWYEYDKYLCEDFMRNKKIVPEARVPLEVYLNVVSDL